MADSNTVSPGLATLTAAGWDVIEPNESGRFGAVGVLTAAQVAALQGNLSGATLTLTLNGSNKLATASKVGGRSYVFTDPDSTHEVCTASDGAVLTVTKDGSGRAISLTGNFQ